MSREFKFRAWDKEDNKMRYGIQEISGMNPIANFASFERILNVPMEDEYMEIDGTRRFEVMQYIGVPDKNGKEIYEGDIVRNFLCIDDHMDKLYEYGIVSYDDETLGFSVFDNENNKLNIVHMGKIEVIGNVYENADLLKEAGNAEV